MDRNSYEDEDTNSASMGDMHAKSRLCKYITGWHVYRYTSVRCLIWINNLSFNISQPFPNFSSIKGDYNTSELLCAERASRVVTIKDRATFQFLRSWAKINKFGDFFLGVNYTTGDTNNPVKYSDGTAYDKTVDYAFDDNSDKFGAKECNYMKSSIKFKPRDTECTEEMAPICIWNSKHSNYLSNICNYNAIVYIYL